MALGLGMAPLAVQAWWNPDYQQRTMVTMHTRAAGVTTTEGLSEVAVPLRLHSGNFDFLAAKADGSDLRIVAGDDKTPLKFSVDKFDGGNHRYGRGWVRRIPVLKKGPIMMDAMRTLDDMLRRTERHQTKKRSMLRALKPWRTPMRQN